MPRGAHPTPDPRSRRGDRSARRSRPAGRRWLGALHARRRRVEGAGGGQALPRRVVGRLRPRRGEAHRPAARCRGRADRLAPRPRRRARPRRAEGRRRRAGRAGDRARRGRLARARDRLVRVPDDAAAHQARRALGGALEPARDPSAPDRGHAARDLDGHAGARADPRARRPGDREAARRVDVAVEVERRSATRPRPPRGLAAIDGIDADAAALAKRIRAAPKHGFVPVITLRQADYERVAAEPRRDPRRVAERAHVAAAADQDVRPRAARHRRAGDGRAAREDPVARPWRRDRPVGPPGRATRSGSAARRPAGS